ncbi:hypothetical protein E2C01_008414 [Portunus trituberculatus]|uniref:Uncharacterized protein n=1 Tax=Portunus trituberculatus TaxID=210409 RepID=A0A5B7D3Y7_PORTR|nr:hypothetical protein [Portunus trituberculatus]
MREISSGLTQRLRSTSARPGTLKLPFMAIFRPRPEASSSTGKSEGLTFNLIASQALPTCSPPGVCGSDSRCVAVRVSREVWTLDAGGTDPCVDLRVGDRQAGVRQWLLEAVGLFCRMCC